MARELGGSQISALLESVPGIVNVLRNPVADALVGMIRTGAGLEDFSHDHANELVQYAVRRGLIPSSEGEQVLKDVGEAVPKKRSRSRGTAQKKAAPKRAEVKAPVKRSPFGRPAAAKPAVVKAPVKPAARKPAAPKPAVKKPAVKKPAVKKTAVKKTAVKKVKGRPVKKAAKSGSRKAK